MTEEPSKSRRTHVIAIVAVLALAIGVGMAYRQWRPFTEMSMGSRPSGGPVSAVDTSDAVIEEALKQIPAEVDSEAIKTRWTEDVKGFDLDSLGAERREVFLRYANSERCTCGCGYTLAACRAYDLTCPVSQPRVASLYDSVRVGRIRSAKGLRVRPAAE